MTFVWTFILLIDHHGTSCAPSEEWAEVAQRLEQAYNNHGWRYGYLPIEVVLGKQFNDASVNQWLLNRPHHPLPVGDLASKPIVSERFSFLSSSTNYAA